MENTEKTKLKRNIVEKGTIKKAGNNTGLWGV